MPETRYHIFERNFEEIRQALLDSGEPDYRASQIWRGLYKSFYQTPEEFSSLPKKIRDYLGQNFLFSTLAAQDEISTDKGETTKVLFHTLDGNPIEAVLMRYHDRNSLCLSTQSGCLVGCVFCATGKMGFHRNLTAGEMVEQVLWAINQLKIDNQSLTNLIFMGMGEPFLNYDNVMKAIHILNHSDGLNFGARRMTISTAGVIPAIQRFILEKSQVNLSISLHAGTDPLRSSLVPLNKKYPLPDLISVCREYTIVSHRRITFEYVLIENINDYPTQAHNLAALLKCLLCHVNIIPLNPFPGAEWKGSPRQNVDQFVSILKSKGIPCTVRLSRGAEIQAGCGQLAGRSH